MHIRQTVLHEILDSADCFLLRPNESHFGAFEKRGVSELISKLFKINSEPIVNNLFGFLVVKVTIMHKPYWLGLTQMGQLLLDAQSSPHFFKITLEVFKPSDKIHHHPSIFI